MKILLICTAFNSLSQRIFLTLGRDGCHAVSIEFALSDESVLSAVALARPDLIICPFLTTRIPKQVYENYMTLIIHPGPPGDTGPSSLDWLLLGDDGSVGNTAQLLEELDLQDCRRGRSHWAVTVLQATEHFDEGPVWAFEQFPIDIDATGLSKSQLYRGAISQAAIDATLAAISRIERHKLDNWPPGIEPLLARCQAHPDFSKFSVSHHLPFQGGRVHHRPLLKASHRDFDAGRHTAKQVSRRIRCSDSQPGALSRVFGPALYVYGGAIEDNMEGRHAITTSHIKCGILGVRENAICISTSDGKGVWITHVRRPKTKDDVSLWPKTPAASALLSLGILDTTLLETLHWQIPVDWSLLPYRSYQEIWVDMQLEDDAKKTAYLYFDFYNGAMSTAQCSRLIEAMDYIISQSTPRCRVDTVIMMGGTYFSNGIALNVIEAADDPATESWSNINRIDDAVYYLLHVFPSHGIKTVAAIRGNAAAGGVALAAACDTVISGPGVVLNPSYRAMGLSGSEYHTLSYTGRCGRSGAEQILSNMLPLSAHQAQALGLIDLILPASGAALDNCIRTHISATLGSQPSERACWKANVDLSPTALALSRTTELREMSLDFWSARSTRYHERRSAFVRKVKPTATPLRLALHRRATDPLARDEEESASFDSVAHYRRLAETKLLQALDLCSIDCATGLHTPSEYRIRLLTPSKEESTYFACLYTTPTESTPITPPMTPVGSNTCSTSGVFFTQLET